MASDVGGLTPNITAPQLFDLKGQNAFLTGGSRGIGAAMALALAEAGASVCIAQRDTSNTKTRDEIRAKGCRAEIIAGDLTNIVEVKTLFQRALEVMGGEIHIVVNCGGIVLREPSISVTEEDWDKVVDINLKSLFLICQAAGRHMIPLRRGKIINVTSINCVLGGEQMPAYAASKGGVSQLTKALSNEWSKHNIQVNAIAPGYTETDM